ncbi:aldose 1-epimerase [Lachnospiraceae bacterium XBB1006]|nr:aldose 1-epimerase [Lachnospiraceae bacterium XBB1006]
MKKETWGCVAEKEVFLYTLQNEKMKVDITNYGATLVGIHVPDRAGQLTDVLLGYDCLADYQKGTSYFGALVGRCANRIHNDVTLDGKTYALLKNEGENVLHSGVFSTAHQVWEVMEERSSETCLWMHLMDKEEVGGLPGTVEFTLRYELLPEGSLSLQVEGMSDATTLLNVTSHGYFNLAGHDSKAANKQKVWIAADSYMPVNAVHHIPTGEIASVEGSVFDFRQLREMGEYAYDHNYMLRTSQPYVAEAWCEESGIRMRMKTNCPCMQFYNGKWIKRQKGKGGAIYDSFQGFCFEPQYAPDAIHLTGVAKPVFEKQQPYHFQMILTFDNTIREGV